MTVSVDSKGRETKWAINWSSSDEWVRTRLTKEEALAKLVDPERELLTKAQDNAGDGVEVDSYHRLGWYRMACGGIARVKRTHSKYVLGDATEAGSTFDCTMWDAETGEHVTNSDWNLIRWKGGEQ